MSDMHLENRDTIEYDHPLLKNKKLEKGKSQALFFVLFFIFVVQVSLVLVAIFYQSSPLDKILNYNIDVNVESDGIMKNTYTIEWKVLNSNREGPLEWVKIGIPKYANSIVNHSNSICSMRNYSEEKNTYYVRVDFFKMYYKNEVVKFSFTTTHNEVAFEMNGIDQFEFIPGWFNEMEVDNYRFSWSMEGVSFANNTAIEDNRYVWKGSLKSGETTKLIVQYEDGFLPSSSLALYKPFIKPSYINEQKIEVVVVCVIAVFVLLIVQVLLLDRAIVYGRGRGFMPRSYYVRMYTPRSGRGGGGGGCACGCACACACAGGGRAGCSVKDFANFKKNKIIENDENPAQNIEGKDVQIKEETI